MSVRKRRQVAKNGQVRERWVVDTTDAKAKRHTKSFERRKEAELYHRIQSAEAGGVEVTFAHACERWIERCRDKGLAPATIAICKASLARHVMPWLGQRRLADITSDTCHQLHRDLTQAGNSTASIRRALQCVRIVLETAQDEGYACPNPRISSVIRRLQRRHHKAKTDLPLPGVHFPSKDDVRLFFMAATPLVRALISIGCFAGLRRSEMLGLAWSDIDFESQVIRVQRFASDRALSRFPSTARHRTVPIASLVTSALRQWQRVCPTDPDDLVFPGKDGRPMSRHAAERQFKVIQVVASKQTNVEEHNSTNGPVYSLFRLHLFYAWWCLTSPETGGLGMSPSAVSRLLGYPSVSVTLVQFGHFLETDRIVDQFPHNPDFLAPPSNR